MSGPPYVFDPNVTYPDPNVQAWAHYYAHGGTDPTGAVYFISVPGVKEGPPQPQPQSQPQRGASIDSLATLPEPGASQTAPLNISKGVRADQPQPQQLPAYGASPYAPVAAAASPTAAVGEGPPVAGQAYYGLTNQFGAMDISSEAGQGAQQTGPQGVGAPA